MDEDGDVQMKLMLRLKLLGLAGSLAFTTFGSAATEVGLEDFESVNAPAPWSFSNGAEFPGATGTLTRATGHSGSGARLTYDFSGGGAYVSANFTLPEPLTTDAIALWLKAPAAIRIRLRVGDATGQTLQYSAPRPMTALDTNVWFRQVVLLGSPAGWWGGSNDGIVHFPIRSLSIVAGDGLEAGLAGTVDFDEVTALSGLQLTLDPAVMPVIAAPPGSGPLPARLGVNIHFTSDNRALDAARAAGIGWVRMDLTWSSIERQTNAYDFSAFDGLLDALDARGMRALLILDYGNSLHTTGPPTNAAQVQAFGNYAFAAARHFAGRRARYEVWNEPNIAGFWSPAPDTNQYAALLEEAVRRVHEGDPAAEVSTGGLAGFDHRFARGFLNLTAGAGADAVGVHPYLSSPESLAEQLLVLRAMVQQLVPANPPVWDTEWGYTSVDFGDGHDPAARLRQGLLTARRLLCSWSAGLPLMIYYDIRDDGLESTNREHNFGLLARDYSDKPAMQAVRALSAASEGRVLTGYIPTDFPSVLAARLDGSNDVTVAVWNAARSNAVELSLPAGASGRDFLGNPVTFGHGSNGPVVTLAESNGPVYLTFPGPGHATSTTLVPEGAVWKYLDDGTNLGTNWIAPDYNDASWRAGPAMLGYGDANGIYPRTTNSWGPDASHKFITTYYRHRFNVTQAGQFAALRLRVLRDDGAAVYLNGRPVLFSHLRGQPTFDTPATRTVSGADETNFLTAWLAPSQLVEGANVLAAEIHQVTNTSSDLGFDLELNGTRVVLPPTSVSLPPVQVAAAGARVTLPVTHDGLSPFAYEWWFNRTNLLTDQTNATLLMAAATTNDSGLYQVVVSNLGGVCTSAPARLIVTPALATSALLIPTGSVWRYLDDGSDQGTAWRALDFDDQSWRSGAAKLGSNDTPRTTIHIGPAGARFITTYFRHAFAAENAAAATNLAFRVLRDDGVVVWLNGSELCRMNMPGGTVNFTNRALNAVSGADEANYFTINITRFALREGTNILAAELHQSDPGTSDAGFDLELRGGQLFLAPYVLTSPQAATVAAGASVRLCADIGGTAPLRYQWRNNGTNLPGVTTPTLVLSNLQPAQSGFYTLLISNPAGSAETEPAFVRVWQPPSLNAAWKPGTGLMLRFIAPEGSSCLVLNSTNLADWEVWTNLTGVGTLLEITDTNASRYPQRFYRLQLGP